MYVSALEKTHLILSGGAMNGIVMLGVLEKLPQCNFTHIAGSSVGALLAVLLCFCSIEELKSITKSLRFLEFSDIDISLFMSKYGFIDPSNFLNEIAAIIEEKTMTKHITFRQLHELTGKTVYITGTNLTTHTVDIFNLHDSPDMNVMQAVEISISIPFIFKRVEYNNSIYVDGCVGCHFPDIFPDVSDKNKLGILVDVAAGSDIDDIVAYVTSIVYTTMRMQNQNRDKKYYSYDVITIPHEQYMFLLQDYSEDDIDSLIKKGNAIAEEYIANQSLYSTT